MPRAAVHLEHEALLGPHDVALDAEHLRVDRRQRQPAAAADPQKPALGSCARPQVAVPVVVTWTTSLAGTRMPHSSAAE